MTTPGSALPPTEPHDVRVVAFYRLPEARRPASTTSEDLPEWRSVRTARPAFVGHEQPLVPGELGYCDVRSAAVRNAQAALAASHAISGFCYVFQPVDATMALDATLAEIAASGSPDFPFCVCWETTALNAGAGFGAEDPSRQRHYNRDECIALVRNLTRVLADQRYLRIGERPLFLVSSPDPIPEVQQVAWLWRAECARAGVGNPWIACLGGASGASAAVLGFDAIVECPPLDGFPRSRRDELILKDPAFGGDVRSYRSYMAQALAAPRPDHVVFRTVMPGWDDTACSPAAPRIFVDGNPESFGYWTERALDQTRLRFAGEERLLFIRSWNEWNAGSHLEPDARHGRRYLDALRSAVQRPASESPRRPSWESMKAWAGRSLAGTRVVRSRLAASAGARAPSVSVVVPAYNHERYIISALDSVLAQTHGDLEIIVVNDGSRDATGALLDGYASRCGSHALTVVHQPNAGAHEAINRGMALARGELIAILNSDDRYAPTRLEHLLGAMNHRQSAFAFSRVRYIDDDGRQVSETDPYVRHLRQAVADGLRAPDWVFTLVYSNVAVSTGNFVFRRQLLERIGGFCAMRVCHDWDFLLAASYETPLAFVDGSLYEYRLHGSNTVASARVNSPIEMEQMLVRFFAHIGEHPVARDPALLETFFAHVRGLGLGGYLPGRGVEPR
jgi:glycosyltransferase involved in cell wall biosynthesis